MKQKGFTLIELLVVISIIGLLASVFLVALNGARIKSRDAKRLADISQIERALELYASNNNSTYPGLAATWSNSNDPVGWGTLQTSLSAYASSLPHDPKEDSTGSALTGQYTYSYRPFGCTQGYLLVYKLEVATQPDHGAVNCSGVLVVYGSTTTPSQIQTVGINGQ